MTQSTRTVLQYVPCSSPQEEAALVVATMAFAMCQTPLSLTAASKGGVPYHHLHFKDEKREVEDRGR